MDAINTSCWESSFFGSATVGERGQFVIPSEARAHLGIRPGDKLLVMKHPVHQGLMIAKIDSIRGFLDDFARRLDHMESLNSEDVEENP